MPPGQGALGKHKAKPSKVSTTKRGKRKPERKNQTGKSPEARVQPKPRSN